MTAIAKELATQAGKALAAALNAGETTPREIAVLLGYGTPDRPNTTRVGLMRRGTRAMSLGTFLAIWRQTDNQALKDRLQAVLGYREHLQDVPDPTLKWPAHLSQLSMEINVLLGLAVTLEEEYAKNGNQPGPVFFAKQEEMIRRSRSARVLIDQFGASIDGRANLKLQRKKARPFRLVHGDDTDENNTPE